MLLVGPSGLLVYLSKQMAVGTLTPNGDTGVGSQVRRNLVPGYTAEQIARDELSESSEDSEEDF